VKRFLLTVATAILASACGSTAPTPVPPPPTPDPPAITCPASQTIQLTGNATSATATYVPTTVGGKEPVTVACAPPSGSTFTVGAHTVSCTATDALQRTTSACVFGITVLAPLPPPTLTVRSFLAFGDSITWGEDGRNSATALDRFVPRVQLPTAQTYPGALYADLVARYTTQAATLFVDNGGNPGEAITNPSSSDGPNAVTRFGQLLPGHGVVLIMEGTNDLQKAHSASNAGDAEDILGRAAAGLRTMVITAKASGVRPFLATLAPMNPTGTRGQLFGWELVAGFNARIAAVASLEQVPLVDVNKAFAGNLGLLGFDGVHPTSEGYKLIADTFFTAIKSNLETPATSTLMPSFRRR
jgi:lysophospholipase L1-like esterase